LISAIRAPVLYESASEFAGVEVAEFFLNTGSGDTQCLAFFSFWYASRGLSLSGVICKSLGPRFLCQDAPLLFSVHPRPCGPICVDLPQILLWVRLGPFPSPFSLFFPNGKMIPFMWFLLPGHKWPVACLYCFRSIYKEPLPPSPPVALSFKSF